MSGFSKTFFSVCVAESDLNRNTLAEAPWVSNVNAVRRADVLVLPWHEVLEEEGPIYPQGTADLFKFLANAGLGSVELPVSEPDYVELAMHGKAWRLPTLLLSAVVVPIFVNLISNRLDEFLPGFEPDDTVHFEMIVERPNSPCVTIKYEGPAARFPQTMLQESQKCFEAEKDKP